MKKLKTLLKQGLILALVLTTLVLILVYFYQVITAQ